MPVSKGRRKKAKRRPTPPKRPPAPAEQKGPSPTWYVVTMFGLMGLGILIVLVNYMGFLPGGTSNLYLLGGLACIAIGFAMTLDYR